MNIRLDKQSTKQVKIILQKMMYKAKTTKNKKMNIKITKQDKTRVLTNQAIKYQ